MKKIFLFISLFVAFSTTCLAKGQEFAPANNDTLYAYRLANRQGNIKLYYYPEVKPYIEKTFQDRNKATQTFSKWLSYKPLIDSIFKAYKLPEELKTLPVIVSGMNAFAMDDEGNAGWWLMPFSKARAYGLKINSYIDERNDFQKSTVAFAKQMHELNRIYQSWELVLASYASSSSAVNKAIRQAGKKMNYHEISKYLPPYAQRIVYQLTASVYCCNFYTEHHFTPQATSLPVLDSARITRWITIDSAAARLHMSSVMLSEMNPIFRKKIIPPAAVSYYLKFPATQKQFASGLDSISFFPYMTSDYMEEIPELEFNNIPVAKTTDSLSSDSLSKVDSLKREPSRTSTPAASSSYITYKVRSGDGLYAIARKYNVSVEDIRKWNKLKNNSIFPGQKLKIYK